MAGLSLNRFEDCQSSNRLNYRAHAEFGFGVLEIRRDGVPRNAKNTSDFPSGLALGRPFGIRPREAITMRNRHLSYDRSSGGLGRESTLPLIVAPAHASL